MADDRLRRLRTMLHQVAPADRTPNLRESLESRAAPGAGPPTEAPGGGAARVEARMAGESLETLRRGGDVDPEQRFALEAIVMPFYRPVVDVVEDRLREDQLTATWRHVTDDWRRRKVEDCFRAVGRIDVPGLPSLPYAGTGFVVGPDLLMTNRHVAQIFAQGVGTRGVRFQAGQTAAVDFVHEIGRTAAESLAVERVVMVHPYWDMALLKVRGLPPARRPLALGVADPAGLTDREVVVVGYPGYDPSGDDEFQRIQNRIFRGAYYVKRLQPGLVRVRDSVDSFGRQVSAVTHDCSTLGGNSGSVVLLLPRTPEEDVRVVGLHFAGQYLVANYAVPAFDLAQDGRVVDAGVTFVGRAEPRGDFYGPYWRAADAGPEAPPPAPPVAPPPPPAVQPPAPLGGVAQFTIPLHVSVSIGAPTLLVPAPAAPGAARPATVEGLFSRRPPVPTADLPQRFSLASLASPDFGWGAALSMALASRLTYETAAPVEALARDWGFQSCRFLEADATGCFIAATADVVVIAFRGTAALADWLANLDVLSTNRPYGDVHRGFLGAFQVVEAGLRAELAGLGDRPVVLTGHSLGGALATVAAAEWDRVFPVSRVYTYGQPAVGKGEFEGFMGRYATRFFRFVNDDDVVPRVPPTYRHVGRLFHFDPRGGLPVGTESPGAAPESVVLEGFLPSVSDHFIDAYIAKIAGRV